jgi:myo-inositol-1(or 4)-monophosphatase
MRNSFEYKKAIYKAAKLASKIQKKGFGKIISTRNKENISNILSEIDLMCDKIIVKGLQNDYPSFNIISEESGFLNKNSNYTWVIDPLDGTSNYVAGIGWFGILITLFYKKKPIAAGALLPVSNDFYYAELNKGAYLNNKPIKITDKKMEESLFAFSTDSTMHDLYIKRGLQIYLHLINNCRNVRSTNSLLDMLYVADNKLGGCVNLFTKIWDIAAPYLIIREAGGIFMSIDSDFIEFDLTLSGLNLNYGIIVASNIDLINAIKNAKKKIDF